MACFAGKVQASTNVKITSCSDAWFRDFTHDGRQRKGAPSFGSLSVCRWVRFRLSATTEMANGEGSKAMGYFLSVPARFVISKLDKGDRSCAKRLTPGCL